MAKVVLPQMIDYYRKQNNMTMVELGSKLGKTTSAISRWISGSRSPMVDDLERLSDSLIIAGTCFYLLYKRHKENMPRKKVKPTLSEPVNMQGKHF